MISIVNITDVKTVIKKFFPKLWKATKACLAVTASLLLEESANATALVLYGVASSGKGTVLGFFSKMPDIAYKSDYFTPRALVSHYANMDKEALGENDMLKRISKKCLIVPDLGVIFGKRKDDLKENLGILTRAMDGEGISTDSGVHGRREVTGDCMFAMLAATTPFGYKLWDEMGRFGSRLLFLSMPVLKDNESLKDDFKSAQSYKMKKELCGKAVSEFFTSFWNNKGGFRSVKWDNAGIPEDVLTQIMNLAVLLSELRGMISMWTDVTGDCEYRKPIIEDPHRAMSLLMNIAKGNALIDGREQLTMDDVSLLIHIVVSSCPEDRGAIMREFIKNGKDTLSTSDVCLALNVSNKHALNAMSNLEILNIVKYEEKQGATGRPEHCIVLQDDIKSWLLSDQMRELFSKADADTY